METQFSDGRLITAIASIEYIEAYNEECSYADYLRAWAFLIYADIVWKLQGWYGRTAKGMIDDKMISMDGVIDWDVVNECDMFS